MQQGSQIPVIRVDTREQRSGLIELLKENDAFDVEEEF